MVKNILVTGATGKQGGALIDALLANSKSSWKIYALTRDSKTPSAQRLLNKGGESVELVEGDLNNQKFLDAFLQPTKDIYAIFSVQSMDLTQGNSAIKKEIEQGIRLADAAKKANVKHFVYTGSGGSERKSGVPHFDSKWVIEEHIRRIELPYTILRPVFFMDNFLDQGTGGKVTGAFFRYQMAKGRKLQMISVRDIGYFAFLALQNPAEYLGKEIEIAGDDLTFDEANEIYKRHNDGQDLPCTYSIATTVIKLVNKEVKTMFDWFDKKGYIADIPKLKKSYPELSDFDSFLQKSKEKH